jgi:hypothetical protein
MTGLRFSFQTDFMKFVENDPAETAAGTAMGDV